GHHYVRSGLSRAGAAVRYGAASALPGNWKDVRPRARPGQSGAAKAKGAAGGDEGRIRTQGASLRGRSSFATCTVSCLCQPILCQQIEGEGGTRQRDGDDSRGAASDGGQAGASMDAWRACGACPSQPVEVQRLVRGYRRHVADGLFDSTEA